VPSSWLRNRGEKSHAPRQTGRPPRTPLETGCNGIPGSRCRPVRSSRSSTCRGGRANALPAGQKQAVYERRSGLSQPRKLIQKPRRPTIPYCKLRPQKRRAYARFGWPRKQPTRRLQVATPRQRRPGDLSRADACQDLRPQPRQNSSKAQRIGTKLYDPRYDQVLDPARLKQGTGKRRQ